MGGRKQNRIFLLIGAVAVLSAVLFFASEYGRKSVTQPAVQAISTPQNQPAFSATILKGISALGSAVNSALNPGRTQLAAVEGSGSGLIGWWKFDEGSGTASADSSGNSNNLTISNATWGSGKVGQALSFDGNDSRATAAGDLVGTGDTSVCAWFYANSAPVNAVLMGNGNFNVFLSTSNRFGVTSDGTNDFLSTTNALVTNTWNHMCVTRDSTGAGIIYINGAYNSNGNSGTPKTGSAFAVGNHPWINEGWNGQIDDVRLYNRVLSGPEVSAIYTEGGGAATPAPIVSSVSISAISTTAATINWTTDQSTDSQVDYGLTTAYGNSSALNSSLVTTHTVALAALTNGATYHYRVDSRNSSGVLTQSADQSFTTSQQATIIGTTITAASCSQVDVQNAINEASDGMTVMVPAGTCAWTQTITANLSAIPKSLILEGAGIDQTIIQDAVPRSQGGSGANEQVLFVATTNGKAFRLTGFTFENSSAVTDRNYVGSIDIEGTSKTIRVDHNKFLNLNAKNILLRGYEYGVIDHNTFNTNGTIAVTVYEDQWPGPQGQAATWGDGSWASPLTLGTGQAIYVEDNVIKNSSPEGVTDGYGGARIVVRYNSVTDDYITNHGTESAQRMRGTRSMEIYGNVLTSTTQWFTPVYLRSGTGVIFNNKFNGYGNQVVTLINFRDEENTIPWGECDGTSPYDQNESGTFATGTNTGSTGTTLTDSTKSWTNGQWAGYSVIDKTTGQSDMISSNVGNTLSFYPNPSGVSYTWNKGDTYQIKKEDRCLDQPGAGTSDYISGDTTPQPVGWVHQITDPLYSWGNTYNNVSTNVFGPQQVNMFPGVDYFNNTARPGYTPYQCPNPIITTGFDADANPDTSYCQGYVAPPPPTTYSINASAGANGTISPSGSVSVNSGAGQTFTITPASGYQVGTVTVDGSPVSLSGATYAFTNVAASHTIAVTFTASAVTSPATSTSASSTSPGNTGNFGNTGSSGLSGSGGVVSSGGGGGVGSVSVPLNGLSISGISVAGSILAGVKISWTTSAAAKGQVLYGITSIYGSQTALDSVFQISHSQAFAGLSPNTLYHFNIKSNDMYGNAVTSGDLTFVTTSAGGVTNLTTVPASAVGSVSSAVQSGLSTQNGQVSTQTTSATQIIQAGSIDKSLYEGMTDNEVTALQDILDERGYAVAAPGSNGSIGHETTYFGPATQAALEKFQCAKGIVCSGGPATTGYGLTGPKTRAALNQTGTTAIPTPVTSAKPQTSTAAVTTKSQTPAAPFTATISNYTFKRSLELGMTGTDVYELQVFLNTHGAPIALSGAGSRGYESTYFGLATQSALVRFQKAHGITATGYFGPATIKEVESLE